MSIAPETDKAQQPADFVAHGITLHVEWGAIRWSCSCGLASADSSMLQALNQHVQVIVTSAYAAGVSAGRAAVGGS